MENVLSDEYRTRVGFKTKISQYHIESAAHLANLSYRCEEDFFKNSIDSIPFYSHIAYVTGSIFLSVSFLEARINELIFGAFQNINPWNHEQGEKNLLKLQNLQTISGTTKLGVLDKYQLVLELLSFEQFIMGANPFQNAKMIIDFSNALVHFEQKSNLLIPENPEEENKLLKMVQGRFPLNPIAKTMNKKDYPDILLGYGCAKWAVTSSILFVNEFNNRIMLDVNYTYLIDNFLK